MIRCRYVHTALFLFAGLLCILQTGGVQAETTAPPRNPNSAKGCAICHYRWIDTFFIQGKGTDLVPYQSEKVAADPEMCFSCHDGSVVDSRERLMHGRQHKTGVKPPADMKIPQIFPLDEKGNMQCATCHTAHGVPSGPDVKETIFLRVSDKNSAMCRMCHPDKDGGTAAGNHSLGMQERMLPRGLKQKGALKGRETHKMICETCHIAHGSTGEGYLVRSAADSGLCLECHGDKNMTTPSGERNANHVINVVPGKTPIPAALLQNGAKLGAGGRITCQTCHKIHNNALRQPALLVRENHQSDFCIECHTDKQRIKKTKHNLAVSAKTEKNLAGKTVAESGLCSACHLPHGAARTPYMKNKETDRTTALCLSCHAKGKMAENVKLSGYSHPVDIRLPETVVPGDTATDNAAVRGKAVPDLPLFNAFGVTDAEGKMTCATCHDTHGAAALNASPTGETGPANRKTALLRKPSPEICKTCHADKFGIQQSRHDFRAVFPEGNRMLTQSIPDGDLCRNCHRIHDRGPRGYVWGRPLVTPTGDTVQDRCTGCHGPDGMAAAMTVGERSHPVNVRADMQPGEKRATGLPLFDAVGKPADDGLMTCYTCHDPHRRSVVTDKDGHPLLAEGHPVDRFLRMDVAPSSDLCIACHIDKADVRRTPHNLVDTAPASQNAAGRTPFESGVCGVCHLTHNSEVGIVLWARNLGDGGSVMDRMCNACHSANGAAADKVPPVSSHPDTVFLDRSMSSADSSRIFPLFDKATGAAVKTGNLSCASCHDTHRWTQAAAGEGANIQGEGDATTSFLRPHIHDRICKDCHGVDSLFKFKYFHKTTARTKQPHGS